MGKRLSVSLRALSVLLVCLGLLLSGSAFAKGAGAKKPIPQPFFMEDGKAPAQEPFNLEKEMAGCSGSCYPGSSNCYSNCECSGQLSCCQSGCSKCCSGRSEEEQ